MPCALPGKDAGYVYNDQHVDFTGSEACAARGQVVCRLGLDMMRLPFDLCEERFRVKGLLAKLLSGEPYARPQDEDEVLDCDPLP